MGHTVGALYVFECLLNKYKIDSIIELGTGFGGMALFLGFQAKVRDLDFWTIDTKQKFDKPINFEIENPPSKTVLNDEIGEVFTQDSCFDKGMVNHIKQQCEKNRVLIYCDNGARYRELKRFMPMVKKHSIIGVHDWGRMPSINPFEVQELARSLSLREIEIPEIKTLNTFQKFWIKK
jgi:hypothetical protein